MGNESRRSHNSSDANNDGPGHGNEGGEQSPESSLYRHEISILLQERQDMGLEKLNQSELESLLAGVLGAIEQARGSNASLGLFDTMPSLSSLAARGWALSNCYFARKIKAPANGSGGPPQRPRA